MPEISRNLEGVPRTWSRRFHCFIQEPRAEAGLEVPSEDERKAFEETLWPMLRYQPKEKATAQQVLKSEWTKGCLPALGQSISISRSAKGGERKIQD
jgi:hypothetical protein